MTHSPSAVILGDMIKYDNASSAAPAFVSVGLNPSGSLTPRLVVLFGQRGREQMHVYRDSSSEPGRLSVDLYELRDDGWKHVGKHPLKLAEIPVPPPDAKVHTFEAVVVWTKEAMADEERTRIVELMFMRRSKGY